MPKLKTGENNEGTRRKESASENRKTLCKELAFSSTLTFFQKNAIGDYISMNISEKLRKQILTYQQNEITEHNIYKMLAQATAVPENNRILEKIADDELQHYQLWKTYTQQDIKPNKLMIWKYYIISRFFGLTFGLKLMEKDEVNAQKQYSQLREIGIETDMVLHDENEHEHAILQLLDEERLRYVGSIVLGLNDALVELTGALAGFTLALQETKLIAVIGLITGIAAALSMGSSEYLSTKSEETVKKPFKAALYTLSAYIVAVLFLILPYLFLKNAFVCLSFALATSIVIIAFFNYYVSVAKDLSFRKRFIEMTALSLGVAAVSFFIGFLLRSFIGIEV
ncbi:MAG: VIT1/CCC1 transporter family protein [Nitrospirota bacterium]